MSKKKNHKKKFNPQIIKGIQAQTNTAVPSNLVIEENQQSTKVLNLKEMDSVNTKNDLKRIFFTTLLIFVLLFVIAYISNKTSTINNFGDWLIRTTHLNN